MPENWKVFDQNINTHNTLMSLKNTQYYLDVVFLRKKIKDMGISQNGICRVTKIPQSAVNDIFAGKRPNPTMDTVCKIAECVGVDFKDLIKRK